MNITPQDMTTAQLVAIAERQAVGVQAWLDMTPERRTQPGRSKDGIAVNISMGVTIPMFIAFVKELHRRGIETGWEWFVQIWDEETEAAKHE
jgi:hypothetical protein